MYYLTNDCDAYCGVTFEKLEDGCIDVKYDINGMDIWETNWEELGKMLQTLDGWEEEVMYVIEHTKGLNWYINLGSLRYTDRDVYLGCTGNNGPVIDLGKLAECYNDCETCDICHNHNYTYDDDGDYVRESCRDCEGCHKHPCVKWNGRKALEEAITAQGDD